MVEAWGERLHPATRLIVNESAHVEGWAGDHELHAFNALWDMDEIMAANFMTFADVVEREPTTSGWATRAGTSTTSCTRIPSSSARPTCS